MKIKQIDRRLERDILIGMIVDRQYMARIAPHTKLSFFKNAYARTVAGWCLEYFEKYDKVPFKAISDIYDYRSKRSEVEDDEVNMIEKLLETIDEDYTESGDFNTDFLLDLTEEYFNKVRIEDGLSKASGLLEEFGANKAQETLNKLVSPVNLTARRASDPFVDKEKVIAAFEQDEKPLVILPGDLGELLNEQLTRASMVSFQAPEKSGKTWMLSYIKRKALEQGLKVLEFQLGDLTEKQVIIRDSISISQKSNKMKYCGTFKKPLRWIPAVNEDAKECPIAPKGWDVEYEEITIDEPLTGMEALKQNKRYYKKHKIEQDKSYRLVVSPAKTMNMRMIDDLCDRLYVEEGFIPDVIVSDYMDILDKENTKDEGRDAVNENWIGGKALVNKRSVLLVTATQSDAGTYDGQIQTRENYSNDKRKFGHVNGMYGMNQTDEEKKYGIQKINIVIARDGEYTVGNICYVLQNLRCGQPVVDSLIPKLRWREVNQSRSEAAQSELVDKVSAVVQSKIKRRKRR